MDVYFSLGKELMKGDVCFMWTVREKSIPSQTEANLFLFTPLLY